MTQRWGVLLLILAVSGCNNPAPEASQAPAQAEVYSGNPVEGLRVATRVGCNGCHGADAGGKVFSEDAEERIVAPNLTQRRELYDAVALEQLLRHGKTHDGHRPLGMPVFMFQNLSDREIADIDAWLRALPKVDNPGLPEKRWSAKTQQQVADGTYPYDDDLPVPEVLSPKVPPTETLALGKHLAMTSCPECHAPDLNGWPGDNAPNLVVAKAYTAEQFARLMKTGITANGTESASGLMTAMGRKRFSVLTEQEVSALKAYLDAR